MVIKSLIHLFNIAQNFYVMYQHNFLYWFFTLAIKIKILHSFYFWKLLTYLLYQLLYIITLKKNISNKIKIFQFYIGKAKTSLILSYPVNSITNRSTPTPNPPVGGNPWLNAIM